MSILYANTRVYYILHRFVCFFYFVLLHTDVRRYTEIQKKKKRREACMREPFHILLLYTIRLRNMLIFIIFYGIHIYIYIQFIQII